MRIVTCRQVSFAITLLATLSMLGSAAFARGGRGGGRSGGGRSSASGGARSVPTGGQRGGAVSNAGSRPGTVGSAQHGQHTGQHDRGHFGKPTANAAGLPSQAANLQSKFASSSQHQGMLQNPTGQAANQLSQQQGQLSQDLQTQAGQLQNGASPFSPSWYAQHPNAWQATHPHADAAVIASAAAVTAWVGAAYYPATSSAGSTTTVVYAPTIEEAATTPAASFAVAPVAAAPTASQPPAAQPSAGESESWLPIGTYAVSTTQNAPALRMVQLVVDRHGTLRGVYYDSVTDTTHNLLGKLDTSTQIAKWQLESNSQVSFQTPLQDLTQPTGNLQVNLPVGAQQWLLARVANAQ